MYSDTSRGKEGRSLKLYHTIRWHVNGGRLSHFACGGEYVNSQTLRWHDQALRLPQHKPPSQVPIPACMATHPQVQMDRNLKLQHYQTIRWHVNDGCLTRVVCVMISCTLVKYVTGALNLFAGLYHRQPDIPSANSCVARCVDLHTRYKDSYKDSYDSQCSQCYTDILKSGT